VIVATNLLGLEQQDGAVSKVEVDEVFRLCIRGCVSIEHPVSGIVCHVMGSLDSNVPWVTKLPKFRPTMQCHVGPLRSSNYVPVSTSDRSSPYVRENSTYCSLDVLRDILLDRELLHGFLGWFETSSVRRSLGTNLWRPPTNFN